MTNNIDGRNRASPEEMKGFVERYERLEADKASEHGAYMKRCAEINADLAELLEEAKSRGLPKKSVKAAIDRRKFQRKIEALDEKLDDDQKAVFIDIREALGEFADLPLGAAAVQRDEGAQDPTTAAIVAAVTADEPVQTDIEDAANKAKIEDQRKADEAAFAGDDAARKASNVTSIDPKAARANRAKKATESKPEGQTTAQALASGEVPF